MSSLTKRDVRDTMAGVFDHSIRPSLQLSGFDDWKPTLVLRHPVTGRLAIVTDDDMDAFRVAVSKLDRMERVPDHPSGNPTA